MPRILMCRPDHYGIRYEINPWMRTGRDADPQRARAQWDALYQVLTRRMGLAVELIEPAADWPDMVFTANAGLAAGCRFVMSNFRHEQRAGEAPLFARWFAEHGYVRIELPPGRFFEGEGDALWAGQTLLAGYHFRSDLDSHRLLAEVLGCRVISLELADRRFYHLDTCLAPLDGRSAVWYPAAFDEYAQRAVRDLFEDLIELSAAEALRFAANAVVADRSVAINAGCPTLTAELTERGYRVFQVELGEFLKAGGAAKCLVLFLER